MQTHTYWIDENADEAGVETHPTDPIVVQAVDVIEITSDGRTLRIDTNITYRRLGTEVDDFAEGAYR